MSELGQRGRSSRWSDDHPGLQVTLQQGEGPQPIGDYSWVRIALGDHNVLSECSNDRGIAGCAERRLSGLGRASARPLGVSQVWRADSTSSSKPVWIRPEGAAAVAY